MARLDMAFADKVEMAANTGCADALFNLGMMYCIGREVPQDLVSAHKYFNLATIRGNHTAQDYRREIAQEMSQDEIAEAQRQARSWLTTH